MKFAITNLSLARKGNERKGRERETVRNQFSIAVFEVGSSRVFGEVIEGCIEMSKQFRQGLTSNLNLSVLHKIKFGNLRYIHRSQNRIGNFLK